MTNRRHPLSRRAVLEGALGAASLAGLQGCASPYVRVVKGWENARSTEFVIGKRRHDDSGADRIDPRAAFAPTHRFRHHAQRISPLGKLIGVQRIFHLAGLNKRK